MKMHGVIAFERKVTVVLYYSHNISNSNPLTNSDAEICKVIQWGITP